MQRSLSSKDQVVLPLVAQARAYRAARHAVSGLPVMMAVVRPTRNVIAARIARLNAGLL